MQELLNHPAVQAGFAPFLIALLTAELLQRIRLSSLALIAGFSVTIYLASDFTFEPLTSTRKLVLIGLTSPICGLFVSLIQSRWLVSSLPIIGGTVVIWTISGIVQQQPSLVAFFWASCCAAYVAILVWAMDRLANEPLRSTSAGTALGLGTGGAALVGASALLGQLGLSLGSSAAALLMIHFISNKPLPVGRAFTLPLALVAGLTGCIAVLSAKLPWYVLPILAGIPVISWLTPLAKKSPRILSLYFSIPALSLAATAIYVTWRTAGDVLF